MPWIQYDSSTGNQVATNSQKVSDEVLASIGRAQIFYDGDPSGMMVDIASGEIVPSPPSPPPPADMITHIFNALIQQGWIDPANVDSSLIARANVSLAVNGAKTIG